MGDTKSNKRKYRINSIDSDIELRERCRTEAIRIYGDPLPQIVRERMEFELNKISENKYSGEYLLGAEIAEKSKELGVIVTTRGMLASSFVTYLCGMTNVNPLPAHYICPYCHYFELPEVNKNRSWIHGFDIERKNCPKCNKKMKRDGASISAEILMGWTYTREPDIILNIAPSIYPDIVSYLQKLYGEEQLIRAGISRMDQMGETCKGIHPGGIFIIPKEADITDYTDLRDADPAERSKLRITDCDYSFLEPTFKKYDLMEFPLLDMLHILEKETGIAIKDMQVDDKRILELFLKEGIAFRPGLSEHENAEYVKSIIDVANPKCFSDIVKIYGLMLSTGAWHNNGESLILSGHTLGELPTCRDDILCYLIQNGIEGKKAYSIMNRIKNGKGITGEDSDIMTAAGIPLWYIESCQKTGYLFPRSQLVEYAYVDWVLAGYKTYNVDTYSRVCEAFLISN